MLWSGEHAAGTMSGWSWRAWALAGMAALITTAGAAAQQPPPDAPPPAEPQSQPADEDAQRPLPDLEHLQTQLSLIRQLRFTKPVPAVEQSLDDFRAFVVDELAALYPPEKQEGIQLGLRRLGLIQEEIDFGAEFADAFLTQAAAYYDPHADTFYYLWPDMPSMIMDTIAAHELVHALQDQHFNIEATIDTMEAAVTRGPRDDDAILAFRFLVEGEATYVQTIWQMKMQMGMDLLADEKMEEQSFRMIAQADPRALIDQMKMVLPADDENDPIMKAMLEAENIPRYILDPLYAAYLQGAYFCMKLRHSGGWEALSMAYGDLPATCEQVMHPDKYTRARDQPTPIQLPRFAALANNGWRLIDSAIHGELYLGLLLNMHGASRRQASRAASGWDGDIYQAWTDDHGQVVIILATTWDSEADAGEFFDAYREILPEKYPGIEIDGGPDEPSNAAGYFCGDEALGHGQLTRRGREVFIVEGASEEACASISLRLAEMQVEHVDAPVEEEAAPEVREPAEPPVDQP